MQLIELLESQYNEIILDKTNFNPFSDGFICDDDAGPNIAIQKLLRKITGYNPDAFDDRHKSDAQIRREMAAGTRDIMEEETRAMRMAQLEDKLEKKRGAKSLGFLESSDEEQSSTKKG